jgi:hypothetical protein
MGKLWQTVLLLIAVVVLIGVAEQVIRTALPTFILVGLIVGAVWLVIRLYQSKRGGW